MQPRPVPRNGMACKGFHGVAPEGHETSPGPHCRPARGRPGRNAIGSPRGGRLWPGTGAPVATGNGRDAPARHRPPPLAPAGRRIPRPSRTTGGPCGRTGSRRRRRGRPALPRAPIRPPGGRGRRVPSENSCLPGTRLRPGRSPAERRMGRARRYSRVAWRRDSISSKSKRCPRLMPAHRMPAAAQESGEPRLPLQNGQVRHCVGRTA